MASQKEGLTTVSLDPVSKFGGNFQLVLCVTELDINAKSSYHRLHLVHALTVLLEEILSRSGSPELLQVVLLELTDSIAHTSQSKERSAVMANRVGSHVVPISKVLTTNLSRG